MARTQESSPRGNSLLPFPIDRVRGPLPLWVITDIQFVDKTKELPERIHQQMDKGTIEHLYFYERPLGPEITTVAKVWKEWGQENTFIPMTWSYMKLWFGTDDMYSLPEQKDSIHGKMHLMRALAYGELLGQYKKLSPSNMKALRIALSIHDMARENDMEDKDHGLRSANNVTQGKNYLQHFIDLGMDFTPEEVEKIKILSQYHEVPWEKIPEGVKNNPEIRDVLETMKAADAGDRFRSPNPTEEIGWWPKREYFLQFFDGDERKVDAFLRLTRYVTHTSEMERFTQTETGPISYQETAVKHVFQETGLAA